MEDGNNSIFYIVKKKGYNIFEYLIINYYWVLCCGGLFWLVSGRGWLDPSLIPLVIYLLLLSSHKSVNHHSILDTLWILCLCWGIFSWFVNDYPSKYPLIFLCISEQIAYMMMYWVVRKNQHINLSKIIQASYLPLLITCFIGIYCFIYEPSWYASRTREYSTDFEEFEFKRLRSIFIDGYIIMYYCAVVIVYEFFLLATGKLHHLDDTDNSRKCGLSKLLNPKSETAHLFIISVCLLTVFLGIQRSALASIVICLFLAIYYSVRFSSLKNLNQLLFVLTVTLFICAIALFKMEGEQQFFYLNKIVSVTEESQTLASERLFHNKTKEFDMLGDGMGRHNLYSDKFVPHSSLRDGEYNKILTEQGYIGFAIYILFTVVALLKAWKNFKYLHVEFALIIVLLVSMIGANPLSTFDKHPVIFWAVFGQIANFRRNEKN